MVELKSGNRPRSLSRLRRPDSCSNFLQLGSFRPLNLTLPGPCVLVELVSSSWKSGRRRLNLVDPNVDLEHFFELTSTLVSFSTVDSFPRSWSEFLPQFALLAQLMIKTCKSWLEVGIIALFKIKSSSSMGKTIETYTPDEDSSTSRL